jgi:DnaJ-class molecular chaperone
MKKECDTCGGSGQISYFKGVSRFLLSVEECDVCNGIGYTIVADDDQESAKGKKKKTKKKSF